MKYLYRKNTPFKTALAVLCFAALAVIIHACKKAPNDDVKIVVNTDLIKYSVLVDVVDAKDQAVIPANAKLSISGPNGDMIYEISGKKSFTMHDGEITVGLHPLLIPTTAAPAKFNLELSADGYLPVTQQVIVKPGQPFQALKVKMFNLATPPTGYYVAQKQMDASGGSLTSTQVLKVRQGQLTGVSTPGLQVNSTGFKTNAADPTYYDDALTSVVLPAGTTFYYYKTTHEEKTGTRSVPVYGEPVTEPTPNIPISITGGTVTVVPNTYRPIIGYYDEEYKYDAVTYKQIAYSGSVNAVCIYSHGDNVDLSVFPDNFFTPRGIATLNSGTVSEDELLFTSAVLQKVDKVLFVGKVDGQDICISPSKSASWTTSYVLDPAVINPATGAAIKDGDMIEIGVDELNGKTLRTAVVKTGDGKLRAQSQTSNMGYFYKAPYITPFGFNFDGTVDPLIPDVENVSGYLSLTLPVGGIYSIPVAPNVNFTIGGKIASKIPTSINAGYSGAYFNNFNRGSITNGSTIAPFKAFSGLKPLVTLNISVTCTGDPSHPISVKPTAGFFYNYGSADGSFNVRLVNGSWSTRGLTLGQQLSKNLSVGSSLIIIKTDPLHADNNDIGLTLGYKDNLICKTY